MIALPTAAPISAAIAPPRDFADATLLVFADDWGRHPSSCQHLVGRLLDRHPVLWVNTIGLRPPRLDLQTCRRGWEKLKQWSGRKPSTPNASIVSNPQVLNPHMWPWMRSRWDRRTNDWLLARQLVPQLAATRGSVVGITTLPITAGLIGRLPVDRWVYYCVDDFSEWPGLDRQPLLEMEAELLDRVDDIVAVSPVLCDRLRRQGREATLLAHGVDLAHWRPTAQPPFTLDLSQYPRPHIVFWGLIDRRLDVEFLTALDARLEAGTIVLLGPCESSPLRPEHRRVVCHGSCTYDELPQAAAQADVLVMPYIDAPVTQAMQPLKLLEYLATDRPVVVRDLPSARTWLDCLDIAANAAEFAIVVLQRVRSGLPEEQRLARRRLVDEDWSRKADQFEQFVLAANDGEAGGLPPC